MCFAVCELGKSLIISICEERARNLKLCSGRNSDSASRQRMGEMMPVDQTQIGAPVSI